MAIEPSLAGMIHCCGTLPPRAARRLAGVTTPRPVAPCLLFVFTRPRFILAVGPETNSFDPLDISTSCKFRRIL